MQILRKRVFSLCGAGQLIEVGNEIPAPIMAGNILNAVILEKT
jgi:hypothetical protein